MNYPQFVEINGKKYKINTDFRVALKCNEISKDASIGNFERALAIIYLLFGEEAMADEDNAIQLLELAKKYLSRGKQLEKNDEKPDMDYIEDYAYIKTSFRSDYGINLDNEKMHWWEFYDLICGLSNSEFGNCCVLNRIRNLRNFDPSTIKDAKERQKIIKAQKDYELKFNKKENHLTTEQLKSIEQFNKLAKL